MCLSVPFVFVSSSVSCDLLFGGCVFLRKIKRCHSKAPIGNSESKCGLHGGTDRKMVKKTTDISTASRETINRESKIVNCNKTTDEYVDELSEINSVF